MKLIEHKVDNEFFEGTVKLTVPSYVERLRIMKELNFKVVDGKVESNEDTLEKLAMSVEKLEKFIKEVLIKVKSTGEILTSVDDLGAFQEGAVVISELTAYLSRGVALSNP